MDNSINLSWLWADPLLAMIEDKDVKSSFTMSYN
jgi:hypothetical protein